MSIRIWDVPYAYGPIYAYGAEQSYQLRKCLMTLRTSKLKPHDVRNYTNISSCDDSHVIIFIVNDFIGVVIGCR